LERPVGVWGRSDLYYASGVWCAIEYRHRHQHRHRHRHRHRRWPVYGLEQRNGHKIPAFSGLLLPAVQHGNSLVVGLTIDLAGSRVEVDVTALAAQASDARSRRKLKPVVLARLVRKDIPAGRLKLTVPLNTIGRQALKRHRHLTLTVKITVIPPAGKPQTATHTVMLRNR
jgi:hypothetical protein